MIDSNRGLNILKDILLVKLKKLIDKSTFDTKGYKLVLVIKDREVTGKVIKISSVQRRPKRAVSKEDMDNVKLAKKILKNKTDALYLYTLLVRVREELEKVKLRNCSVVGQEMILSAMGNVGEILPIKMLEVKR